MKRWDGKSSTTFVTCPVSLVLGSCFRASIKTAQTRALLHAHPVNTYCSGLWGEGNEFTLVHGRSLPATAPVVCFTRD